MSEFQAWPSWRYGPNGASKLCENEAEVPKGWVDHPEAAEKLTEKVAKPAKEAEAKPAGEQAGNAEMKPAGDVDAAGVAFDPALHAASRSFTSKGLWRMKVGVKRPEAPTLDL